MTINCPKKVYSHYPRSVMSATRSRKECIRVPGKPTKCTVLGFSDGQPGEYTLDSGCQILRTASANWFLKVETNTVASFRLTVEKATGITSGPIVDDSKAGGT